MNLDYLRAADTLRYQIRRRARNVRGVDPLSPLLFQLVVGLEREAFANTGRGDEGRGDEGRGDEGRGDFEPGLPPNETRPAPERGARRRRPPGDAD